MIKEFKKSIGYICPYCSTITLRNINLFDFSGNTETTFECSSAGCNEVCISFLPKADKYIISISCPMCDDAHTFNIKKITFWKNNFFVLTCPETGIGILFIGDRDTVEKEIKEQEEMFVALNEEFSVSDELNLIFETVERINELAKDNAISCSCKSTAISIEIDNEKITLMCRDCKKSLDFPANEETLDKLLNTNTIVLE